MQALRLFKEHQLAFFAQLAPALWLEERAIIALQALTLEHQDLLNAIHAPLVLGPAMAQLSARPAAKGSTNSFRAGAHAKIARLALALHKDRPITINALLANRALPPLQVPLAKIAQLDISSNSNLGIVAELARKPVTLHRDLYIANFAQLVNILPLQQHHAHLAQLVLILLRVQEKDA
jgi:hypothetical protein